jgi:hypothetical protein
MRGFDKALGLDDVSQAHAPYLTCIPLFTAHDEARNADDITMQ